MTFRVAGDTGEIALRVHQPTKSVNDVLWEHVVAERARAGGVTTPRVHGFGHARRLLYSTYEWLGGKPLELGSVGPAEALGAGELLGHIHRALQPLGIQQDLDLPVEARHLRAGDIELLPEGRSRDRLNADLGHQDLRLVARLTELAADLSRSAPPSPGGPRQWLHGDFGASNVLFDGCTASVIDWDECHIGDPAFDLATGLLWLCDFPIGDPEAEVGRTFLTGYGRVIPLAASDVDRALWYALYRVASNTDWLSVAAAEQDWRRLSYIENDIRRLEVFSRLVSHGRMPALARRLAGA
jgi:Ser/Thr protein kinase RdoA (MazF antagonist)